MIIKYFRDTILRKKIKTPPPENYEGLYFLHNTYTKMYTLNRMGIVRLSIIIEHWDVSLLIYACELGIIKVLCKPLRCSKFA